MKARRPRHYLSLYVQAQSSCASHGAHCVHPCITILATDKPANTPNGDVQDYLVSLKSCPCASLRTLHQAKSATMCVIDAQCVSHNGLELLRDCPTASAGAFMHSVSGSHFFGSEFLNHSQSQRLVTRNTPSYWACPHKTCDHSGNQLTRHCHCSHLVLGRLQMCTTCVARHQLLIGIQTVREHTDETVPMHTASIHVKLK